MESVLLDVDGHRRSPATMPGYHRGRPPRNKSEHYPADPPTVEEIVAVMRTIGDRSDGYRLRALIVLLWRAGLRISEAPALQESDLDRSAARCSSGAGRAASAARSDWIPGRGTSSTHGSRFAGSSRSARCCACSMVRLPADGGKHQPRGSNCTTRRHLLASGVGSRRINCGTRTLLRWRMRAFRSWLSSGSWGTPTLVSRASTSRASTAARSSAPSTAGHPRRSPRAPASR